MISPVNNFTTEVTTKNGKERIYLSSKDKAFLDRALETLKDYTKNSPTNIKQQKLT